MQQLTPQQLLAEIEDLIRTMPPRATIRHDTPDNHAWFGRAAALINRWDPLKSSLFNGYIQQMHGVRGADGDNGFRNISTIIHQARQDLRLTAVGPLTVAVEQGNVFDYFDEVRKVVETAKQDVLFVDPYLDSEFASRYLPQISPGVSVRLLTQEKLASLLPAVELVRQQHKLSIEVRSSGGLHDRYIFVDRRECYLSGASFKDGAKKAPTNLTQISDAFSAMWSTYDQKWQVGAVQ